MIRVLHMLGSLNIGGSQMLVLNLYRHMNRELVQFDIVIDRPDQQQLASEFKRLGSRIFVMPAFNGYNAFEIKQKWNVFFKEHPEYKILHSHVRSYASLYLPIARKHGVKTIIHSHSTSNGSGITAWIKAVMQYPLRYQADYLMACSNEAGRWLFGEKMCKKANYIFLPNAIDIQKYQCNEVSNAYRRELGVEGKFVLGHVGRFHEAKNHKFLLNVFAGVCARRSDAVLLLVGDGELRWTIEEQIKHLHLEDRVILTGSRSDVPQLMQAMDVFLFPSTWEGLPVTVIEAQAAGLPCFLSDRITKDVDVSDLIRRLPIQDPDLWVQALLEEDLSKNDVTKDIKAAGFDIRDSAETIMKFYTTLKD